MTRIVCMSDLHCRRPAMVPDGDILVVAGDWCLAGTVEELKKSAWIADLPHRHKIGIAGNHDWWAASAEREEGIAMLADWGVMYLEDSHTVADGLVVYGSPWQPAFCDWAFNLPRGKALQDKWAKIPVSTDVLITHGPPYGILDEAPRAFGETEHVGCRDLRDRVLELADHDLQLHVFGHIHNSYGQTTFGGALRLVNASICTERYRPDNKPIAVDL